MRFRHLIFVFLFFLAVPLFAKGGVMSGAGKLSVIRTQYFDIIYPVECTAEAEKIAFVADGYYEEIAARLQTDCRIRFPVSVTRSMETTNGYFTVVPYNAIVIQAVPPEISLDQNSDSVTSVFYHELTHAVTTNSRNAFSRFVAAVFGDWFAPAGFLQTSFMHEGAAVSFESLCGEGRVHDPYSRQMVVQTKLDGHFPDWRDVTGARDIFPDGTDAYAFGSLFCHFLQETYGIEKYAAFWKTTGSIHGFKGSLKKTYGKPIAELWKDFESWVTVPDSVTAAISSEYGTADFFVANGLARAEKTGFSKINSRRSVFKCIDTTADGIAWFDSKTGGVWYAKYDSSAGAFLKQKKVFTCAGVNRLSFSDDGNFLAVSYFYADKTTKTALAVYDVRGGRLVPLPMKSVRDAGFVRDADGALQLACVNFSQSRLSVDFYAIGLKNGGGGKSAGDEKNSGTVNKKNVVLQKQIFFSENEIPYSPCSAFDGGFACIVKKGMDWSIRLYEDDTAYREYGTKKTILHHLHARQVSDTAGKKRLALTFSYADFGNEKMLPRAGLLYVKQTDFTSELVLQDDDVSGSVLDAVLFPTTQGERLLYVAVFYDTQRLMQMDFSRRKLIRHRGDASNRIAISDAEQNQTITAATDFPTPPIENPAAQKADRTPAAGSVSAADVGTFPRISYNPFRYYAHTMRIPLGMVSSYKRTELDSYAFGYTNLGTAFVGATIASSTPWQDNIFVLSGGWNPFDKNGGLYLSLSGGNDTFTYSANSNLLFDGYGFMQTTEGLSLGKTWYNRFGKSFGMGATGTYFYGHEKYGIADDWSARARGYVQFSTVRKMSPRYADSAGIIFQPFILWERVFAHYVNAGLAATARIPGLFPIALSATLFPSATYAASASATVYLFSYEVQKGIPVALYIDRFYLSASYAGKVSCQAEQYFDIARTVDIMQHISRKDYSDVVQVKLGANASVNMGVLSRFSFDTGIVFQYRPNPRTNERKIAFGVSSVLVY